MSILSRAVIGGATDSSVILGWTPRFSNTSFLQIPNKSIKSVGAKAFTSSKKGAFDHLKTSGEDKNAFWNRSFCSRFVATLYSFKVFVSVHGPFWHLWKFWLLRLPGWPPKKHPVAPFGRRSYRRSNGPEKLPAKWLGYHRARSGVFWTDKIYVWRLVHRFWSSFFVWDNSHLRFWLPKQQKTGAFRQVHQFLPVFAKVGRNHFRSHYFFGDLLSNPCEYWSVNNWIQYMIRLVNICIYIW